MKNGKKVLVTGGAGFIGSHLVDKLLSKGWTVTAVDNMEFGHPSNLDDHKFNKMFDFYNGDIKDKKLVRSLVKDCSTVFHMAAHADIRESGRKHNVDLENNLIGTTNILEAMSFNKVQELVFASTSAVYGEAKVFPTPEDYSPIQTSLYGASKMACEAFAQAYTQLYDMKFWSFRFANVVGERARRGVIWDFVRKLQNNPYELEILGDGKQSKEYLYIEDCISGILTGYESTSDNVNTFNLGLEEQTFVDKVADIVIDEMNLKGVRRTYTGGRKGWVGDNPIIHLSIEKLKKLGWSPKTSSEEAIRRTVRWILKQSVKTQNS
jgi:UDP-glucose 4-epimerase